MLGKHASAERLNLTERDGSHSSPFKSEAESTDAREKVEDIHCAPVPSSGDRMGEAKRDAGA